MINYQWYFKDQTLSKIFDALPCGAKEGFKRKKSSHYDIIRKIVSRKVQANPLDESMMGFILSNFLEHLWITASGFDHRGALKTYSNIFDETYLRKC